MGLTPSGPLKHENYTEDIDRVMEAFDSKAVICESHVSFFDIACLLMDQRYAHVEFVADVFGIPSKGTAILIHGPHTDWIDITLSFADSYYIAQAPLHKNTFSETRCPFMTRMKMTHHVNFVKKAVEFRSRTLCIPSFRIVFEWS